MCSAARFLVTRLCMCSAARFHLSCHCIQLASQAQFQFQFSANACHFNSMHARAAIGSACCLSVKVKGRWPHALVACEGFEKLKWRPQFMQGPMEPEQHIFSSSPKVMGRIITFLGGEHVPDAQEVQAFVRASTDIWLEFAIYNSRREEKKKQRQEEAKQKFFRELAQEAEAIPLSTAAANNRFWEELAQEVAAIHEEWRSRNQCFTCDRVASEGSCEDCGALVCWACSNRSSVYTAATAVTVCHSCSSSSSSRDSGDTRSSHWPWYMRISR